MSCFLNSCIACSHLILLILRREILLLSSTRRMKQRSIHPLQGLLNVVDSCHDSAKQASLMALTAPRVQRGMQPLRLSLLH